MQTGNVSTPFGRRSMELAHIYSQQAVARICTGKSVDKWKVFRAVSAAASMLALPSGSLAVLDALLSFYPERDLNQAAQMVVFPSNMQLSLRAHGMPASTLRRHLALLVAAGLITRKDSANGKRYARKNRSGNIESAFGFDLAPLLARSDEFATLAEKVIADREALKRAKEDLTVCRRDVKKLIAAAAVAFPSGNWTMLQNVYTATVARIPRVPVITDLQNILGEMQSLKNNVLNQLEMQQKATKPGTSAAHIERHINNSDTESQNRRAMEINAEDKKTGEASPLSRSVSLDAVIRACPSVIDYTPHGTVKSWHDLSSAAMVITSMLGVVPALYREACLTIGPQNTAIVMACILERSDTVRCPGGYLRDLLQKSRKGHFAPGNMITALIKAKLEAGKFVGSYQHN